MRLTEAKFTLSRCKVRLPLLTPQFLADRVATEELIRSSHQCRDLLDEAVRSEVFKKHAANEMKEQRLVKMQQKDEELKVTNQKLKTV